MPGFTIQGAYHKANIRGLVTMLIDYLEVAEPNSRLMLSLVDKINLAQLKVVSDTRCLETFNDDVVTVASTRSYDIYADWSINDFLSVRHLYVDGYEVYPLVNGFSDMDLKNDTESNRVSGFFLEGGILYLEPIPSEELAIKLIYVRKPAIVTWDDNDNLEVRDEYIPSVLTYAFGLYHPPGSPKRLAAMVEYEGMIQEMRVMEHLKGHS